MGARSRSSQLDALLYGLAGAFAALIATTAGLRPHRVWGAWASGGLAAGLAGSLALTALGSTDRRARVAILTLVVAFGVVAPTVVLSVERTTRPEGTAQSEVLVVEAMADRLVRTGTPYLSRAETRIAVTLPHVGFRAYAPYQPAMAAFGLPRAASRAWWTDARLAFLLTTALVALAMVRTADLDAVRVTQLLMVVPPTALALATGGDDLPVVALCCWALALADRRHHDSAALAAGAALALKLTAAPVVLVVVVLGGRHRWVRAGALALALPIVTIVPPLAIDPSALVEHLVRYPLGLGVRRSTAHSPLPGVLLAEHLAGGRVLAALGVVAVGTAFVATLVTRPLRGAADATRRTALALAGATLLAPQARFGYLLYPVCLAVLGAMMAGDERGGHGSDGAGDPDVLRRDGRRGARAAPAGGDRGPLARRLRAP